MIVACESFYSVEGRYPTSWPYAEGLPDHSSGHVRLLPHLGRSDVFDALEKPVVGSASDEPPSAVGNEPALVQHIAAFVCPSDDVPVGGNSYRACLGTSTGTHATWVWNGGRPQPGPSHTIGHFGAMSGFRATPARVRDGLSNTAFYSERLVGDGDPGRYTPWRDIAVAGHPHFYYPDEALETCAALTTVVLHHSGTGHTWRIGQYPQTEYNHVLPPNSAIPDCIDNWLGSLGQGAYSARSLHPGGVNVAFGDGAVKFVSAAIDLKVWRAIGSRAGNETETIP